MINLLKIIKIELIKTTKLPVLLLIFLLPVFLTVFGVYLSFSPIANGLWNGSNFWRLYFDNFFMLYSFLLPVVLSVIASSLIAVEYRNNAFQMLYTLPTKRSNIFISKVLLIVIWTFVFLLFLYALILFSGAIFLQIYPNESAFDFAVCLPVFQFFVKIFVACITIGIIHLVIAYCNISQAISVLFASFITVISLFSASWQFSYVNPYVWILNFSKDFSTYEVGIWFPKEIIFAILYVVFFVVLGLILNQRKKKLSL